jgi:spore germination cell wall hydrolase CwlJ-like protein
MAALLALPLLALVGSGPARGLDGAPAAAPIADLGPVGRARLEAAMDPASLALARRFAPGRHADTWGRRAPWLALDLEQAPTLGLRPLGWDDARKVNAALPGSAADSAAAAPFRLRAGGAERARALLCLTQAIYYEAALEPREGQAAVAQTILNRVRHPDFPKSVCGVVYQGASRPGCEFSFACDGSRQRPPIAPYWQQAQAVAEAALDGFVDAAVGAAVYYHADYVFPTWAVEMFKIRQVGAHIFYRHPGAEALSGRYLGGELKVSMAGPPQKALPPAESLTLAEAPGAHGRPRAVLTVAAAPPGPAERAADQIVAISPPPPAPQTEQSKALLARVPSPKPAPF